MTLLGDVTGPITAKRKLNDIGSDTDTVFAVDANGQSPSAMSSAWFRLAIILSKSQTMSSLRRTFWQVYPSPPMALSQPKVIVICFKSQNDQGTNF